jgi:cell division GTPase FtsZ
MKSDFLSNPLNPNPVVFAGIGGGGVNIVHECLSGLKPSEHKHLLAVAANTDHAQLLDYFHKERVCEGSTIKEWLKSPLSGEPAPLTVMPLGKSGLGAGMNPDAGRIIAEEHANEFREFLQQKGKPKPDAVFYAMTLGGGTASGAGPVFANVAKELDMTRLAIVTMPLAIEGDVKMAKALEARRRLIVDCKCSVITLYNQRIMKVIEQDKPLMTLDEGWTRINESSPIPLLHFARKAVQRVARGMNFDPSDLSTLLKAGQHIYQGSYTMTDKDKGSGQKNMEEIVKLILHDPFQDDRIVRCANLWLVWVSASWPIPDLQKLADCIKGGVKRDVEIKWAIDSTAQGLPSIEVLGASKDDPDDVTEKTTEESSGAIAHAPIELRRENNGSHIQPAASNGARVGVNFIVDGKERSLPVSPEVAAEWMKLAMMDSLYTKDNKQKVERLITRVKEETGCIVNIPKHLAPIVRK